MNLISTTIGDMSVFLGILAIGVLGFGNSFYIMSLNADIGADDQFIQGTSRSILMADIYSFQTAMGAGDQGNFTDAKGEGWLWILFILETILVQIVMLNMLVAIMSDTFARVAANNEQNKLRVIIQLIQEFLYLVDKAGAYHDSRYIVITSLDRRSNEDSNKGDSLINILKNHFNDGLAKHFMQVNKVIEAQKEEMKINFLEMEQKAKSRADFEARAEAILEQMALKFNLNEVQNPIEKLKDKIADDLFSNLNKV